MNAGPEDLSAMIYMPHRLTTLQNPHKLLLSFFICACSEHFFNDESPKVVLMQYINMTVSHTYPPGPITTNPSKPTSGKVKKLISFPSSSLFCSCDSCALIWLVCRIVIMIYHTNMAWLFGVVLEKGNSVLSNFVDLTSVLWNQLNTAKYCCIKQMGSHNWYLFKRTKEKTA